LTDLAPQFAQCVIALAGVTSPAAELPRHGLQFVSQLREALAHGAPRIDCIVVAVIGEILRRHRSLRC
jgi:hypothetical protein